MDETVVYDVRGSRKAGEAMLKADTIVVGERVPMYAFVFAFSATEGCWRSEFTTPRFHGVWCLTVRGDELRGSLRALPENVRVRDVSLKRK